MAQRLQKRDESFSDEAKQPTDFVKRIRFMVLGSDEVLINEACDTILRSTDANRMETIKHGTCEFREACVSGRHVSVVKTPTYWLENLKTYLSFSKSVRSMKRDMEFCYSLVFPGPHAFLLVLGDVRNSGKEHFILKALSEVFGQEVLVYSMVLFMHKYNTSDICRNRCVRKCNERYHILENNEDNVVKLFHDATGTMMKQRKANFFTNDLELLDKAETYFKKEFDATYEERESTLRGDLAEMKIAEENLRTKITEMEKQNSENVRELQDLREELDAQRARENQLRKDLDASISREKQLSQQIVALKEKKYELKEELYALMYYKRRFNAELIASNETESQLKSDYEKLQRELEQLKDNEKKRERNPRESKDIENRLQEQKEVQEEYDIQRTSDRREEELLQIVTGSQHGIHISTAVTPPSEDKDKPKPQEDTGSLEFKGLKLVRQNSKKLDPPDVSENKVKSVSGRECEMESKPIDSQSSRSLKVEAPNPVRQNSMEYPPRMSEDKDKPQEDTGYLELEGLKLVRQNSKKLDPPDGSESNLHMSRL